MTAIRVVSDHKELCNSGQVAHSDLDTYITGSAFLVVSGTGPLPPSGRRLVAGTGIAVFDTGPGGTLTITATGTAAPIQWNEVPSGSNDGSNKQFTLAFSPTPPMALMLFINGVKQRQGIDSDFTLTGSIINLTPSTGYRSGSNIDATYPY